MLFGCFFNSHFVFVSGKHISFLNACAFGFAVIILLAKYFHINKNEMLTLWLADKVLDTLEGEDELCLDALDTAKAKLTDINR